MTCLRFTLAAAGCGGDDTTTVTLAAPPGQGTWSTPPVQSTPSETQPVPGDTTSAPEPALEPLPGGRAALDGTYALDVKAVSYRRENIASEVPNQEMWFMKPGVQRRRVPGRAAPGTAAARRRGGRDRGRGQVPPYTL